MSTISTNINLASLKHTVKAMKGQSGEMIECLVIPINLNHLYRGEKGLYLSLIGFEVKNPSTDQNNKATHLVKQSFKKEYLDTLTEDQKKDLPVFGNHSVFTGTGNEQSLAPVQGEDDDLPF